MSENQQHSSWTRVAALGDFGARRMMVVTVGDTDIALLRRGSDVVAFRNRCTHLGFPLAGGRVVAGQIICPEHGACFDLTTGAAVSGPAVAPLTIYRVRLERDEVFVDLRAAPRDFPEAGFLRPK